MNNPTGTSTQAENQEVEDVSEQRRKFLKTATKVAVTAPAVTLLLAASAKPRQAAAVMYEGPTCDWCDI